MGLIGAGLAAGVAGVPMASQAAAGQRYQAIAFDAFPIFDPRPIFKLAETMFPGKGTELSNAWRVRQFEYQWLRALGGRYADFWQATEEGLVFAAKTLQLELTADKRDQLMQAYLQLKAWPDVPAALKRLQDTGVRLAFLSNMTRAMLETNARNAGLEGLFEHMLSTDQVRSYKPDPRAYELGVKALGLKREQIVFAAFAGWDVAGAKWYGYPTFWVNRAAAAPEDLGVTADASGASLDDLARFVLPAG
jgi:2-haloacid dehalogenase